MYDEFESGLRGMLSLKAQPHFVKTNASKPTYARAGAAVTRKDVVPDDGITERSPTFLDTPPFSLLCSPADRALRALRFRFVFYLFSGPAGIIFFEATVYY